LFLNKTLSSTIGQFFKVLSTKTASYQCFLFTFDIKSGYHHVEIFPPHQKYLSFAWNLEGHISFFSFTVLPFGLTSGPYIFTKLLRPLIGFWRDFGIKIAVFIDDGHSVEKDFESCLKNSEFVKSSLAASGFLENKEKSERHPKQILDG